MVHVGDASREDDSWASGQWLGVLRDRVDLLAAMYAPEIWTRPVVESAVGDDPLPVERSVTDPYGRGAGASLITDRSLVTAQARQPLHDSIDLAVSAFFEEFGFSLPRCGDQPVPAASEDVNVG